MAPTKIADIIVPDVFNPYVIQRTAALSALVRSGIVVLDPQMDTLARSGGVIINLPFYNDLTGDDDLLDDDDDLGLANITTGQDQAALLMRGKAWGVTDLAEALSGDDPMKAIGDLVAEFWGRKEQTILIKILAGIFADNLANDAGDHIKDIAIADGNNALDANLIGSDSVIDAATLLGDAAGKLTAIAMHSIPYSRLQKKNLIEFLPDNEQDIGFGLYLGKTVIVDDSCPRAAAGQSGYKYTSYLFGRGAVARGEGAAKVPTETDRDALGGGGTDILISRRHFILHPRGIKFTNNTVTKASPSNTELALAANWDRVYESKNIRIVELITNG